MRSVVLLYVGVFEDFIKEPNVRLVAIDHPVMAEAINIAELADLLELGEKLWLLGPLLMGTHKLL